MYLLKNDLYYQTHIQICLNSKNLYILNLRLTGLILLIFFYLVLEIIPNNITIKLKEYYICYMIFKKIFIF
jgi:hypothetical protein